jgi:AraC family transcriptional regulator
LRVVRSDSSLEEREVTGVELARRAHLSRFHFDRLVAASLGESPAAFRRRILLER